MFKNSLNFYAIVLFVALVVSCNSIGSEVNSEIHIIPQPLELKVTKGNFNFNEQTQVVVNSNNKEVKQVASYFVEQFNISSGSSLKLSVSSENNSTNNSIIFTDKNVADSLGNEGYTLQSDADKIILRGSPNGLFYGVQTLFQLLPAEIYSSESIENIDWKIAAVQIKDKPRFPWRGMHLDVGRHLFPVSFIKKYIDYIAMHKLNVFHWHLTEDQGWRIEIKKYPLLTTISSNRKGSQIPLTNEIDSIPYGGFYTQDEIREVVAYAEKKFVTVVPEIEMPGHSIAVLAAYPELSCTGGPYEVRTKWGHIKEIYCAGNEDTFTFLENVLTEVLDLFPSEYIHIGGDEALKDLWKECSKCQNRIQKEDLKDEHELQSYFISRIEKFVNSKGRKIIGWDEILEGGLAPNAAVMSWRGIEGGISAAKLKHNVVMTPDKYLYFCYYQDKRENEPPALPGFVPLEKVYEYEPVPEELSLEEQKYIIGVQACLWTEYIKTPEMAEYMVLPRMCALSETAWSAKDKKDLGYFTEKMNSHYDRLGQLGANYRWPRLEGFNKRTIFMGSTEVAFTSRLKGTEIRYTTDDSLPTMNSTLYKSPFVIAKSTTLKLIEITPKLKTSQVYTANYIKLEPQESVDVTRNKSGLKYQYFEFEKELNSVKELKELNPVSEGTTESFVFPFSDETLPEKFGVIYKGFIEVPSEAIYYFSVLSNDGSRLFVAEQIVVDNDGRHVAYEKTEGIALKPGFHEIKLEYFQAGGGRELKVFWKGPGFEKREMIKDDLSGK